MKTITERLDGLELLAKNHQFHVERDETAMFIKRDGFGYSFMVNVDEQEVIAMIQDATTFIRDISRYKG